MSREGGCLAKVSRTANESVLRRHIRKLEREIEQLREANYKFVCADHLKQKLAEARQLIQSAKSFINSSDDRAVAWRGLADEWMKDNQPEN